MLRGGRGTAVAGPAPISPLLAILNGVVFAVQGTPIAGRSVLDRAVPAGAAIDEGELWRPLTSLFVHPGGVAHLGANTMLLLVLTPRAERELGRGRFAAAYFGAGAATNAVRYAVGGRTGGGASAGIFAAAGAAGVHWMRRTGRARAGDAAVTALMAAGSAVAAVTSDNHLLALGVGGLLGRAAAGPDPAAFRRAALGVVCAGFIVVLARSLSA